MARVDSDLLGLPIVNLADASVVGEVDGLVLDDATMKVVGFLVGLGIHEAKVLPFTAVRAIGEDAVMIEAVSVVVSISTHPQMEETALKDIALSGSRALTSSGQTVGVIGDFFIDTDTGAIVAVELLPGDSVLYPREPAVLPVSGVHRIGQYTAVLTDDYEQKLVKDLSSLQAAEAPAPGATPPPPAETGRGGRPAQRRARRDVEAAGAATPEVSGDAPGAPERPEIDTVPPEALPPVRPRRRGRTASPPEAPSPPPRPEPPSASVEPAPGPEAAPTAAPAPAVEPPPASVEPAPGPEAAPTAAPEEERRHFLLGKRVLRRVESPSGEVIADEGDTVTAETIQRAKADGLLLVLSLHVE